MKNIVLSFYSKPIRIFESVNNERRSQLEILINEVIALFEKIRNLGDNIYMITNADSGWIRFSCAQYGLGRLYQAILKYCKEIIYAKDKYCYQYGGGWLPQYWKYEAKKYIINKERYFQTEEISLFSNLTNQVNKSLTSIVDFGDLDTDMMSSDMIVKTYLIPVKFVKFYEKPTIEQLTNEIILIRSKFEEIRDRQEEKKDVVSNETIEEKKEILEIPVVEKKTINDVTKEISFTCDLPAFSIILARTFKGGIGLKGKLPWYVPEDLKRFKSITTEKLSFQEGERNVVIMGRKTWESLPYLLKDRINIVISKTLKYEDELLKYMERPRRTAIERRDLSPINTFLKISPSFTDALILAKEYKSKIFVIGGKELFQEAYSHPKLETIHLTVIDVDYECDVFFKDEIPGNFTKKYEYPTNSSIFNNNSNSSTSNNPKGNEGKEYYFITATKKVNTSNKPLLSVEETTKTLDVSTPQLPLVKVENENSIKVPVETSEKEYLKLLELVLAKGILKENRTSISTISYFGYQMRFEIIGEHFPLLTTKRVSFKLIVDELLWFLKGETNIKYLKDRNVKIWDGNTSRSFLDSRGLTDYDEGELGPGYPFQWRHFGAKYIAKKTSYTNEGFDQIKEAIHLIRTDPNSRRIIVTAWNPLDLDKTSLPPCHVMFQFYVSPSKTTKEHASTEEKSFIERPALSKGVLSCHINMRSNDLFLGAPFNIASYSLLTIMIAHITGLTAGDLIYTIGDAHIYSNTIDQVKEQLTRTCRALPKLMIKENKDNEGKEKKITDIDSFESSNFELIGYHPHPTLSAKMAI